MEEKTELTGKSGSHKDCCGDGRKEASCPPHRGYCCRTGNEWRITEREEKLTDFDEKLHQMEELPEIQKLKQYPQHGGSNTFEHSRAVAFASHHLADKLGWKVDGKALARGAMLHDYYLYNIKQRGIGSYHHGVSHPQIALDNAQGFGLTQKESNIIRSHMWPLTFFHVPRSREAVLVCVADKYVALREFLHYGSEKVKRL